MLSFDEIVKNQPFKIYSYEKPNLKKLKMFIDNIDELVEKNDLKFIKNRDRMTFYKNNELEKIFKKYYEDRLNDKKMVYERIGDTQRLHAKSQISAQKMPKILRYTLFNKYYEIDIVNAFPTFLTFLCGQFGFSCDAIENYVINRDSILEKRMKKFKIERDDAKDLFLIVLKGERPEEKFLKIPELKNYYDEIQEINKTFNPKELYNLLTFVENYILGIIMKFYESKKANFIPFFDGVLVEKPYTKELEKIINNLGMDYLKIKIKKVGEGIVF